MKNSLSEKGLSMSQAQTISNMCNQKAKDLNASLSNVNNCAKVIDLKGTPYVQQEAVPLPINLIEVLGKIGNYSACQGFLMENLKAKEDMLQEIKSRAFVPKATPPEHVTMRVEPLTPMVKEDWGWDQLKLAEIVEFLEAQSKAAVIGQFIHKGGKLDRLRAELPQIASLEWFVSPGKDAESYPVKVMKHATEEQLWDIHQELANIHRKYEQTVNYYKSKVMNLVTLENASRTESNAKLQAEVNQDNVKLRQTYSDAVAKYHEEVKLERHQFEKTVLADTKKVAALRIVIPEVFQPIVDELMPPTEKIEA